jgi:glycosyltransferase involved in cell wall biosynthesis
MTPAVTDGRTAPAILLDVTRTVSRAGRMPTGIDRVERAWLTRLLSGPEPLFGLLRTPFGFLLLDRAGLARLDRGLDDGRWDRADLLSRLAPHRPAAVRAAEATLRRTARARCLHHRLGPLLGRHLPPGTVAYSVGHANLSGPGLSALKSVPGLRLVVMIHDTIPLDFPGLQRPGTARSFAARFRAAAHHADAILCPSQAAAADIGRHLRAGHSTARLVVAPLGVTPAQARPDTLPPGLPPAEPYFVALGTIEPRKNHALLLDVWQSLGPTAPWLLICGGRGWRNAATFARLDRHPPRVRELPGLDDGAVAALLDGARALLFPSLAEGFGLPLVEALARGTPVVCSDLPVCREVAGPGATFLDPHDPAAWQVAVRRLAAPAPVPARVAADPPSWESHFKTALSMTW